MKFKNTYWLYAAWLWLALILSLSVLKSLSYTTEVFQLLEQTLGGDFNAHILFAAILGFLIVKAAPVQLSRVICHPILLLALIGCLAEELPQYFIPARVFSWLDFMASATGLYTGALLSFLLRSKN